MLTQPQLRRVRWRAYQRQERKDLAVVRQCWAQAEKSAPKREDRELLLRVQTDYFVAGAIFHSQGGSWKCIKAAPIIRWMVGKSPESIKVALLKMGAKWEWIKSNNFIRKQQNRERPLRVQPDHVEDVVNVVADKASVLQVGMLVNTMIPTGAIAAPPVYSGGCSTTG